MIRFIILKGEITMYSFLIRLLLVLELLSPLSCTHVHNDSYGYDPVQQTQCTHEHTPDCFETIQPFELLDPDRGKG